MPKGFKFARYTTSVGTSAGGVITVHKGDCFAADDPIVKAHRDLFDDEPTLVHRSVPRVEQMTAAPGELR